MRFLNTLREENAKLVKENEALNAELATLEPSIKLTVENEIKIWLNNKGYVTNDQIKYNVNFVNNDRRSVYHESQGTQEFEITQEYGQGKSAEQRKLVVKYNGTAKAVDEKSWTRQLTLEAFNPYNPDFTDQDQYVNEWLHLVKDVHEEYVAKENSVMVNIRETYKRILELQKKRTEITDKYQTNQNTITFVDTLLDKFCTLFPSKRQLSLGMDLYETRKLVRCIPSEYQGRSTKPARILAILGYAQRLVQNNNGNTGMNNVVNRSVNKTVTAELSI